jgi:hypothetical protein
MWAKIELRRITSSQSARNAPDRSNGRLAAPVSTDGGAGGATIGRRRDNRSANRGGGRRASQ